MEKDLELAKKILSAVGGKDNVIVTNHCATRLRLTVKDTAKVHVKELDKFEGALGSVIRQNEVQIIVGTGVGNVYSEFIKLGDFSDSGRIEETIEEDLKIKKEPMRFKSYFFKVVDFISGTFVPVLPILVAAGLVSAVLNIAVTFFGLSSETGTYVILSAINSAGFYFLPIFLGYSSANKLGINPMLGMYLGAILVHSSIDGAEGLEFLSIPVATTTYNTTVIPVILGVLFMYAVYKGIDRMTPKEVKFFVNPLVTILIVTPVTLIFLGPIGNEAGKYIASALGFVNENLGWLSVGLIGAFTPVLVMTGTNQALFPLVFATMAELNYDNFVMPGMLAANIAIGSAAIAMSLALKETDKKALSLSAGITGVMGITEPSIFGVLLVYKNAFKGAVIGGLVCGLFAGFIHLKQYAVVSPGIAALPTFIPTDGSGLTWNFYFAIITALIAGGTSFAVTYVLQKSVVAEKSATNVAEAL